MFIKFFYQFSITFRSKLFIAIRTLINCMRQYFIRVFYMELLTFCLLNIWNPTHSFNCNSVLCFLVNKMIFNFSILFLLFLKHSWFIILIFLVSFIEVYELAIKILSDIAIEGIHYIQFNLWVRSKFYQLIRLFIFFGNFSFSCFGWFCHFWRFSFGLLNTFWFKIT